MWFISQLIVICSLTLRLIFEFSNCHHIILNSYSYSISYVCKVVLKRRLGQGSVLTLYKITVSYVISFQVDVCSLIQLTPVTFFIGCLQSDRFQFNSFFIGCLQRDSCNGIKINGISKHIYGSYHLLGIVLSTLNILNYSFSSGFSIIIINIWINSTTPGLGQEESVSCPLCFSRLCSGLFSSCTSLWGARSTGWSRESQMVAAWGSHGRSGVNVASSLWRKSAVDETSVSYWPAVLAIPCSDMIPQEF